MSETDPKTSRHEPGSTAPLPVELAFVVRFRAGTTGQPGPFLGRVEHVLSGKTSAFHSPAELQACLRASLREAEMNGSSDPAR